MISWPGGDKTLPFEDLCDSVVKAIRFAFTLKRKNANRDIPWNGPDIGSLTGRVLGAEERLSAEHLARDQDDQERDTLTNIVAVALHIGMEQGRRLAAESADFALLKIKAKLYDSMVENR